MSNKTARADRDALAKLNVMLKMYDLPSICHFNHGKPNMSYAIMCWRPYPYRIEEGDKTAYMFGTLKELEKQVHVLIADQQRNLDHV